MGRVVYDYIATLIALFAIVILGSLSIAGITGPGLLVSTLFLLVGFFVFETLLSRSAINELRKKHK